MKQKKQEMQRKLKNYRLLQREAERLENEGEEPGQPCFFLCAATGLECSMCTPGGCNSRRRV